MSLNYTRNLTDEEEKILKDQLLDIDYWIKKAIDGKIAKCKGRLAKRRRDELIRQGEKQIPASEIDLVRNAFADPNYKNRKQRDILGRGPVNE